MIERWLPVIGYEGFYEVSDLGRVKAVARTRPDGRHYREKFLSTFTLSGYIGVSLYRGKKGGPKHVHRLVAEAFLGPCPADKHQVNHKDGNKQNPRATNLEWVTRTENSLHAIAHGLRERVTKGAFKMGNRPWNAGKKTGQRPWNYRADRSCSTPGCKRAFFCRGKCERCHRRARYLAERNLLPSA